MKIFISADMEGVTGVVVYPHGEYYDRMRRIMTAEVNGAVQGAVDAGADTVVVADSHGGTFKTLRIEDLHERAELITGGPRPLDQVHGLDASYAAVFLLGYHTMGGRAGVLAHTMRGVIVSALRVNDILVGEIGLNAMVAGDLGVPVTLVTGDDLVAREARELMPWVRTAVVKQAVGRYAARSLPPARSAGLIREAASSSLQALPEMRPLAVKRPVHFQIAFRDSGMAQWAECIPTVRRDDDVTVSFEAGDMVQGYKLFRALVLLAGAGFDSMEKGWRGTQD